MPKPPADHDDSPELSAADFARARWAKDGLAIDPVNRARLDLMDAVEVLTTSPDGPSDAVQDALAKMKAALADLEKAV